MPQSKIRKARMQRRRILILTALLVCHLVAAPGCMMFCPKPSPQRHTELGKIQFGDFATCRRMRVVGHIAERDREGRFVVRVTWLNNTQKYYKAQIRMSFFDRKGLPERGSYVWDLERFPPGRQVMEWTSYTTDAVRYVIELRKAGG